MAVRHRPEEQQMKMTFRTKRRLRFFGTFFLTVLAVTLVAWFCCVVWLERYIVYSSDGARLEMGSDPAGFAGVEAVKPAAQGGVSIFYNEGLDAVEISKDLTAINGYYLDYATMVKDMAGAMDNLSVVPAGTPILVDMKGGYGTFFYSTSISGAVKSASAPVQQVDEFVQKLKSKGYYMIARVSAFQDYMYGNANVTSGIYMTSRAGLWLDGEGCFWLDPASAGVQSWITSAVLELKNMGFHEVVLSNFQFPNTDKIGLRQGPDRGPAKRHDESSDQHRFRQGHLHPVLRHLGPHIDSAGGGPVPDLSTEHRCLQCRHRRRADHRAGQGGPDRIPGHHQRHPV